MPLSKLELKPGVNKEGTRYSTEGGWHDSDKVRFRKGLPEKIGGWVRLSNSVFNGVSRSIHSWRTLASKLYVGVGTNTKFYIESGGEYNDITPLRKATATLADDPIVTTASSTTVRVIDTTGGYGNGDFVTFAGTAETTNGVTTALLSSEFQISHNLSEQATAHVAATTSSSQEVTLDNNTGTIAIGMTVTGTGVGTGVYVLDVTTGDLDQNKIKLSAAKSLDEDVALSFDYSESYTITIASASGGSPAATPAGGNAITATYKINSGDEVQTPAQGWGAGYYGGGVWSTGLTTESNIRLWSQANFGEDLILNYRSGPLYYWKGSNALTTLAVPLDDKDAVTANKHNDSGGSTTALVINDNVGTIRVGMIVGGTGAAGVVRVVTITDQQNLVLDTAVNVSNDAPLTFKYDVPTKANRVLVSDISRFVFCLGTTAYLDDTYVMDPLLVRWSDQEDATDWIPTTTNVAGSLRLSRGGEIITGVQARQEVLIWTDAALYALQLLGLEGWGAQLVGENVSIASPTAVAYANGMAFWMGKDKFYSYDGNVKPLPSTLHRHVFENFETSQSQQVVSGTNEEFNEVWWFYPSLESTTNDLYVVYNYLENLWYHGTMARTAWENSCIRSYPLAATYTKNLVNHETGVDDNETTTTLPITASITSSEFDLQDGHQFAFVWRMLPDITFQGSTQGSPSVDMTLNPLDSSGSGYNTPTSEGGSNTGTVVQGTTITVEPYTTHINTRLRGRQMSLKVESTDLGVKWQLGYPRIDMRPDGRR